QPNNPQYLVARGIFRLSTNPAEARVDLARALTLEPRNPRAHYGMASLVRRENPRDALDHLNSALEIDPNFLEARQLRALVRARQGDPAAVNDVERLVKSPTPYGLYNAGCALAVLNKRRPEQNLSNRA